jgi:hypothetical protein
MPRYQDPKEAERIMREAGAIPLEPYKSSQAKWKCRCSKCKQVIFPSLAPIKNAGVSPCRSCAANEMGARRRAKAELQNIKILKQANFVPLEPYPGTHKPWRVRCLICKKESNPHLSTVKNGSACGFCAGIRLDEIDVRKIYKKAGFEPIGKYPGSTKILWKAKHKKCGVVSAPTFAVIRKGGGCRTCSNTLRVSATEARNLFLKNHLRPLVPYVDTLTPWKSLCLKCNRTVSPNYNKVRSRGHQCGYCAGTAVDVEEVMAFMKFAGFKPLEPYPGANRPWRALCVKCKKEVKPNYSAVRVGSGCKFCSRVAVDPADAEKEMKRRGFKLLEPFPGVRKGWKVQCLGCKKQYKAVFKSMTNKNGCKYCAGKAVDESELLARLKALKLKPLEPYQSAKIPWKCKCLVCGHTVQPTWSRIKGGRGHCAYCSQRRVDVPGALKYMKSINLKPLEAFPGSHMPWRSKCLTCGNVVTPRWGDVSRGQGGCSNCADYGLNYQESGYLYLITHDLLDSHKIGIANSYKSRKFDDRMYQHEKRGWKLYKKMSFKTVKEASDIETAVLKWLRVDIGLPFYLSAKEMPQGGQTETVSASEIDLGAIWAKVEALSRLRK